MGRRSRPTTASSSACARRCTSGKNHSECPPTKRGSVRLRTLSCLHESNRANNIYTYYNTSARYDISGSLRLLRSFCCIRDALKLGRFPRWPMLSAHRAPNVALETSPYKVNSNTIEKTPEHGMVLSQLFHGFSLPFRESWLAVHQYIQRDNEEKSRCEPSTGISLRDRTLGGGSCQDGGDIPQFL